MPLYKLMEEMPYDELLGWFQYFNLRPPEWRADLRASMIMRAQGVDKQGHELFDSLARIKQASKKSSKVDPNLMRLFKGAKKGDTKVMENWQ